MPDLKFNIRNRFSSIAYHATLILAVLCLNGCIDSELQENVSINSQVAQIYLKILPEVPDQVVTRSADESTISDVHILIYNSSGNLIGRQYNTGNSATMSTFAGSNCTIVAIANTGNPNLFTQTTASTLDALKSVVSQDIATLNGNMVNGRLMMSGSLSGVNIQGGLLTPQTISGLTVKRMTAKITLNITSPTTISILGYSVKRLPNKSYYIARPNINEDQINDLVAGDDATTSWFDTSTINVWDSKSLQSTDSIRSLSFYMYENRKGGRKQVNGTTGTLTEQKEKAYYAPDNSSYVEIYATSSRFKSATYRVYLGADNSQNYNVKRNWTYTYNVTIVNQTDFEVSTESRVEKVALPSNCYIVSPGSQIIFPVSRANEDGVSRINNLYSGWSAELLWTDNSNGLSSLGAVRNVSAQVTSGTIKIVTGSAEGNAVIVAKVGTIIVWSWHIWVTSYNPLITYKTYNGKIFMDRNLGAKNATVGDVGSIGFLYQWGRKDPFTGNSNFAGTLPVKIYNSSGIELTENGSSGTGVKLLLAPTTTGNGTNLENSIHNPLSFYYRSSANYDWYSTSSLQNNNLWNTVSGGKSVYDPSPLGWRVPTSGDVSLSPWYLLDVSTSYTKTAAGYSWTTAGWYPAADFRKPNNGDLNKSTDSYYWSATSSNTNVYSFFITPKGNGQIVPSYTTNMYRSYGCSIRCVKE